MRFRLLTLIVACVAVGEARAADLLPPVHARADSPLPEIRVTLLRHGFDSLPTLLSGNAPKYPSTQSGLRESGYAVIRFTVDQSGHTSDFAVEKTNHRYFASEAIVAIKSWRFKPALQNGHPAQCRVKTPFYFRPPG
jgi:TonB family protein